MTCAIHAAGTIELYFYGELPAGERARLEGHLARCVECRQALDDLSVIGAALAARPSVSGPPGGDWDPFMARLDEALARGEGVEPAATAPAGAHVPRAAGRRSFAPYLAAAALLALISAATVFLLRTTGGSAAPPAEAPPVVGRPAARDGDPALVSVSDQHFERSKLVLLGLVTKDPAADPDAGWAYEQSLASTLLGDTRLYRRAAEARGMDSLAGVMRDLELVLLEAAMAEPADAGSLDQLQRLIRRRDLLSRIDTVQAGGIVPAAFKGHVRP